MTCSLPGSPDTTWSWFSSATSHFIHCQHRVQLDHPVVHSAVRRHWLMVGCNVRATQIPAVTLVWFMTQASASGTWLNSEVEQTTSRLTAKNTLLGVRCFNSRVRFSHSGVRCIPVWSDAVISHMPVLTGVFFQISEVAQSTEDGDDEDWSTCTSRNKGVYHHGRHFNY